jgi:acetolactate synthase-1/3 small subunit
MAHVLSVLLDQDLLTLNRAMGVIRRRNLRVDSLAVGASAVPGAATLTLVVSADAGSIDRLVRQLRKMSGTRRVAAFRSDEGVVRELALLRVRSLFGGSVVEEGEDELLVQVAGSNAFVLSFIRALEPFGIADLVRSGAVALERGGVAAFL